MLLEELLLYTVGTEPDPPDLLPSGIFLLSLSLLISLPVFRTIWNAMIGISFSFSPSRSSLSLFSLHIAGHHLLLAPVLGAGAVVVPAQSLAMPIYRPSCSAKVTSCLLALTAQYI